MSVLVAEVSGQALAQAQGWEQGSALELGPEPEQALGPAPEAAWVPGRVLELAQVLA